MLAILFKSSLFGEIQDEGIQGGISYGKKEEGTDSWYPEWKFGKRTDMFKKDFMKFFTWYRMID